MIKTKPLPSQEELNRLLRYEPDTGKLFWRERTLDQVRVTARRLPEHCVAMFNAQFAGKEAFTARMSKGYLHGMVNQVPYQAHRVIYKMMTGEEPPEVDHEDHDRANNRWANLAAVNHAANSRNQKRSAANTSGVTGVSWHTRDLSWNAHCRIDGRQRSLGYFDSLEDAIAARRAFELAHNYHPNHGGLRP